MARWSARSNLPLIVLSVIWVLGMLIAVLYMDPLHNANAAETHQLKSRVKQLSKELDHFRKSGSKSHHSSGHTSKNVVHEVPDVVAELQRGAETGPWKPIWGSLNSRPLPDWYLDAKFGIFIHWGVYSVPSWADWNHFKYSPGAEWYWSDLGYPETDQEHVQKFHLKNYPNMDYQDFGHMFTASLWEPDRWADLVQRAGARYTVLTSKHHEGFSNWPSKHNWGWNAGNIGPKRDLVGDYARAVRKTNVTFGLYYSLYEWFNPVYIADRESGKPPKTSYYVDQKMLPELMELINTYEPSVLWSDGDWEQDSPYWKSAEFLAWLYNVSPSKDSIVTNDRWGRECRGVNGGYLTPSDGFNPGYVLERKWENCQTIGTSWGYNRKEHLSEMKSVEELLDELVTVVAFGGNYLLNLSPTSDGLIPIIQEERLVEIGKWLQVNGEAIYGTRPCRIQKEKSEYPDHKIWYTCKPNKKLMYAVSFQWPADNKLTLDEPAIAQNTKIKFLLTGQDIPFARSGSKISLTLPPFRPSIARSSPWVFVITEAE
eukprot:TRINITY_DN1941_c0_g1_i2.p1 TRINITY_DN1941_c0_g1~~TRINITY_DN1941_c0_g1_i2.p1  ORF type:complete len:541 (-),score=92.73 TRINITY_DN1941_c0_g1_i2:1396-3018(-)